jgi:uncharacterized protein
MPTGRSGRIAYVDEKDRGSAERVRREGSALGSNDEVRRCVICGKPQVAAFRPFCSRRCADVDLHRWLSGAYAVPATEDEDEDGERTDR